MGEARVKIKGGLRSQLRATWKFILKPISKPQLILERGTISARIFQSALRGRIFLRVRMSNMANEDQLRAESFYKGLTLKYFKSKTKLSLCRTGNK